MLKLCTKFLRTWKMRSNIVLKVGFLEVLGLAAIPCFFTIRGSLNSQPMNYDPFSYMISIGL